MDEFFSEEMCIMVELIRELIREIRYEFRMMDNYQNVKSLHKDD